MLRSLCTLCLALACASPLAPFVAPHPARAEGPPAGCPVRGAPRAPINVNTASAAELETLPRIGPARARAIITARERLGGFRRLSQLLRVKGIGRATLRQLRPHIVLRDPPEEAPLPPAPTS